MAINTVTLIRPMARSWAFLRTFDATNGLTLYLGILLCLPAALIFQPLGGFGTPATLFGLLLLVWWTCERMLPTQQTGFVPVRFSLTVFMGAMLLAYAAGWARALSGLEGRSADRAVLMVAALAAVTLLVVDGVREQERLDALVNRLVGIITILAAVGMIQFFVGIDLASYVKVPGLSVHMPDGAAFSGIAQRFGFRRISATAAHPIEFGVVLAMGLPLAVHLAFYAPPEKQRRRWAAVIAIGMTIPMTLSRSAILGVLAAGFLLWCGWDRRLRIRSIVALGVYSVAMKLIVPGLLGTIKSLFLNYKDDPSYIGRANDYAAVDVMVKQAPIVGHGLGTFIPEGNFILDNQYLGFLIETGLIGFLSCVLLLFVGFGSARGVYRRHPDQRVRDLGRALAASILVAIVGFATFDALAFRMVSGVLFVILGIAGAQWRITMVRQGNEQWISQRERTRASLTSARSNGPQK